MTWDEDEYHPELAEYVPGTGSSLRRPGFVRVMRVMIVIGVAALIVPGVIYTVGMQVQTADAACRIVTRSEDPASVGSETRFQLTGAAGPGWYCYSEQFGGGELMLRALGLIPGLQYHEQGVPA